MINEVTYFLGEGLSTPQPMQQHKITCLFCNYYSSKYLITIFKITPTF